MNHRDKTIRIGSRLVGKDQPCFIIAEAGVNHNGDPKLALKLVDEAKEAGADCVKFQTFQADNLVTHSSPKAAYQLINTDPVESQYQMLKKLELPNDFYPELMEHCRKRKIEFLSTPYSFADIDFLDRLGVPAFKVASGQISEPIFLKKMAQKKRPMIISTGMATMSEVATAVECIRETGYDEMIFLQCTSNYPADPREANLLSMLSMRDVLDVMIGYSDHVAENYVSFASVALGARVVEKHFTLDKKMDGPDHVCSMSPDELRDLIRGIRMVESSLGTSCKKPSEIEKQNSKGMRRSLVAATSIKAGEKFSFENVALKRPSSGMHPQYFEKILGKAATKNLEKNEMLSMDAIDWKTGL